MFAQLSVVMPIILSVAALFGLDFATGVAAAIKHKTFRAKMLGDFMGHQVVPFVGTLAAVLITMGHLNASTLATVLVSNVTLLPLYLAQLNSIAENIGELCGLDQLSVVSLLRVFWKSRFPKGPQIPLDGAAGVAA